MSGTTSTVVSTSSSTTNSNVSSSSNVTSSNTSSNSNIISRSVNGNDFIDASGTNGTTVLNGGGGSNYMIGGSGHNTFTIDLRGATVDTFSTIQNLHTGDDAFVFGIDPTMVNVATANDVLPAAPGLDFAFTAPGHPNANLNFPGYTTADIASDRLSVGFGRTADLPGQPGVDYMFVHANT